MITEQDLKEAIAECQGQRNPNANTCIKLAAYLTIQKALYGLADEQAYSYAPPPIEEDQIENTISYKSDTEFSQLVDGKPQSEVMPVLDEMMAILQATNPRLYAAVVRNLQN